MSIEHAVGFPVTASSTVCTLATATSYSFTVVGGSWYEIVADTAITFKLSTTTVTAATNAGIYIPASTIYPFFTGSSTYVCCAVIPYNASAGVAFVWEKRLTP